MGLLSLANASRSYLHEPENSEGDETELGLDEADDSNDHHS